MKKLLIVLVLMAVSVAVFAGDWIPYLEEDKFTGDKAITLAYLEQSDPSTILGVVFMPNRKGIVINTRCYFSDDDNEVLFRFDGGAAESIYSAVSKTGTSLVFTDDDFLDRMKTAKTLIIKIKPYSKPNIIIDVDLDKYRQAYETNRSEIEQL
jgi:hypothetical protein